MTTPNLSRRAALRRLGAIGAAGAATPWMMNLAAFGQAQATGTSGYKALVCLFMYGGNDAYNTVLPTDTDSWNAYLAARNSDTSPVALAAPGTVPVKNSPNYNLRLGGVLPITPKTAQAGRQFALHPQLAAVRTLFNAGRVAIVANVGPLIQPTAKTDVTSNLAALPPKLYSHNDQESVWQSMQPEGATVGWGGAMVDRLASQNTNALFTSISTGSNSVWLAGNSVRPYSVALTGAIHLGAYDNTLYSSTVAQQTLQSLVRTTRENQYFEQDHAAVASRSIDAEAILTPALPAQQAAPWGTPNLAAGALDPLLCYKNVDTGVLQINPITQQLQIVARMIQAHSTLGMGRQIFFIGCEGFDTHDTQNERHADLMAQLAQALNYWDTVTRSMGVDQMVTTFTASDFGRAFASNGDGTDHGWGGHHFVMGGAVKGGDIYGRFPTYGLTDANNGFTSNDQLDDGSLLPALSVEQYAGTLGTWFGMSNTDLQAVMPNINNFPKANWDLGFMNAA
ncbi:MAG TPA: DUF1501 domain-containing protein, partial [Burkholderiaceae bacterium]